MPKARLLQSACAVAMLTVAGLATVPATAQQTTTQPATTGVDNTPVAPVAHDSTPPMAKSNMAPAEKMGSMSGGSHSAQRIAMAGRSHAQTNTSQNGAVDQLNDQSYQAAQRGQAFTAANSGSPMSGSGDVSGGSTSPARDASGASGSK